MEGDGTEGNKRRGGGGSGGIEGSTVEKPECWKETNQVREECEDRHNTSAMFSCYSCNLVQCTKRAVAGRHIRCAACNLVLCTKCAVAGRHVRCAGCSREAGSRHAKWSVWAPRDAGDDASALHGTSWLVCCCCGDKENDDDCCCADKENVDGGGYARYIAHGDLRDLAHARDDTSALHNTSWLVCCCCADKESDDGGGYARYIAHRDLQDLCTWCSECVERRGSADRCRNACGCSR